MSGPAPAIYLDANATTPLLPAARAAMLPLLEENWGNPSSVHGPGQRARAAIDRAREQCAAALGVSPKEITFTSGGTEADALALRGALLGALAAGTVAAAHAPDAGKPRPGLVTTAVEHPAVLGTCEALAREGVEITRVGVDDQGALDLDALDRALARPGVVLCSTMAANNETGVLFPLERIGEFCRRHRVQLHTDAVQLAGKQRLLPRELPVDLLSLSAHKLGGPKGAGLLWARRGVALLPVQPGGHQERGLRGGTENAAGIAGLGEALALAAAEAPDQAPKLAALRDRLQEAIEQIPGARIVARHAPRTSNTLCAVFEGCEGETLLVALDLAGVAVSTGSACSSGTVEPSPVLLAMGLAPLLARGAVRFSLWSGNTAAEIDRVATLLPGLVARAREP